MPTKARKVIRKPTRTRAAPAVSAQAEVSSVEQRVIVTPAKGRPMLTWVGKHALRHVPAFPAQHIETFDPIGDAARHRRDGWADWPKKYPKSGLLFHGDNKEVLAHLLANGFRGKVKLIYIDPPFDSGADYVRRVTLRGPSGTAKIDGDSYVLGEQIQYTDIWANDNYLQFMYERLLLMKELLTDHGAIYVHTDREREHQFRTLLDEVFGPENFLNWIAYRTEVSRGRKAQSAFFGNNLNVLLAYGRNKEEASQSFNTLKEMEWVKNPSDGSYLKDKHGYFSHSDPGSYSPTSAYQLALQDRIYGEYELDHKQRILIPRGRIRIKYYLKEKEGKWYKEKYLDNIWNDILGIANQPGEDTGYPTQKVKELLRRVIVSSSNVGDLILDCFIGSGTTAAVAQNLGRRWIGCDINKGAIQTTSKRLQTIIQEQIAEEKQREPQLVSTEQDKLQPAQLSFAVYRVNDYDLRIQHNEAVNLVCEHIGIERTRADRYFDGTLGKRLVKITPFGHPLTPLDMEELKRELEARPDEERDVVVICLGKELAVTQWLEEWNRLRKKGDVPNKIEVIELRTDPKYGKFIAHKPAQARVRIERVKEKLVGEIQDFISPSVIERLKEQAGILAPQIDDWRAMVDCVMIDPAYDGKVFNIAVSDVPEKKADFVAGHYELPVPKGKTTVAVKITDMLGEEVLVACAC